MNEAATIQQPIAVNPNKALWEKGDFTRLAETMRKSGTALINKLNITPGMKVLDVGCGTGFYTEAFRQLGCETIGLDYSEVALEKSKNNFPHCKFIQMNGFEPTLSENFDIVYCRGFSGANTHDLAFIARWLNKYMPYINPGGFFILSYLSNFTGKQKAGETVNLTMDEILALGNLVEGDYRGIRFFYYFGFLSKVKKVVQRKLGNSAVKEDYSVFFQKQ